MSSNDKRQRQKPKPHCAPRSCTMVRGAAKAIAQERNAKKHSGKDKKCHIRLRSPRSEIGAGAKALKVTCPMCKLQLINHHQLKDHYASKHPKETCPPAESFQ
ncbi:hypothetical protein BE221DRAFT_72923 [Ostreococcus tauri]|uniref:Uncharacterized protein n=1 Tax=Ostreococcus tauri TaxID=70448 RepID=A0A1Y5IBG6_OSTTA|nr:hypothetical protein BE221DRAFT_72923 [Ostreococcus tauri]